MIEGMVLCDVGVQARQGAEGCVVVSSEGETYVICCDEDATTELTMRGRYNDVDIMCPIMSRFALEELTSGRSAAKPYEP